MNDNIMPRHVRERIDDADQFILPPGAFDAQVAQPLTQHMAQGDSNRRMPRQQLVEILLGQHEQFGVHRRHDRRRTRLAGQQRHFAEITAAP